MAIPLLECAGEPHPLIHPSIIWTGSPPKSLHTKTGSDEDAVNVIESPLIGNFSSVNPLDGPTTPGKGSAWILGILARKKKQGELRVIYRGSESGFASPGLAGSGSGFWQSQGIWDVSWALWAVQAGVGTLKTKLAGNRSLLTKY